jgi:monolysocardiolipin acyltransferase
MSVPKNSLFIFFLPSLNVRGRILMEAKTPPIVIPMWLTGFDQLMPEGRPFPCKYLPRTGAHLSVTFGDPVPVHELLEVLETSKKNSHVDPVSVYFEDSKKMTGMGAAADLEQAPATHHQKDTRYNRWVRQKITAIVHRDVQALGRSISGPLLET